MELDGLLHPDEPWLHVLVATPGEAADAALTWQRAGAGRRAARWLRGPKMRTTAGLFDEVAAALQFPPYFGENWDALDECLTDLEWLPADAYALLVLDAIYLLDREGPEPRRILWETLARAALEWGQPAGGAVPRSAKAFRVLLQCGREDEGRLRASLPPAVARSLR